MPAARNDDEGSSGRHLERDEVCMLDRCRDGRKVSELRILICSSATGTTEQDFAHSM